MRIINDREFDSNRERFSQQSDEEVKYQINFDRLMTERGSSVSSVAWSSDTATITNETLSSNKATATIKSANRHNLVKVIATQANGVDRIKMIGIQVIDSDSSGGYN